jgi:predicted RNA-binding protein YlxR (DUF448 family)
MASIQTERRASKSPATAMGSGPERRCLVTRESQPIDRLIRFVAAPDGQIVADIEGRLPGRGLWLTSARDIVDRACRQRAFSNAVRGPVVRYG